MGCGSSIRLDTKLSKQSTKVCALRARARAPPNGKRPEAHTWATAQVAGDHAIARVECAPGMWPTISETYFYTRVQIELPFPLINQCEIALGPNRAQNARFATEERRMAGRDKAAKLRAAHYSIGKH